MKKSTVQYILALVICFAVGCGIALGLNAYDKNAERITPLSGGQTIDFSAYGFTLTVPDDFAMNDYTTNNAAEGGNALFCRLRLRGNRRTVYFLLYQRFRRRTPAVRRAGSRHLLYERWGDRRSHAHAWRPPLHLLSRDRQRAGRRRNLGYLRNLERGHSDFL